MRRDALGEQRWEAHQSVPLASFPTCSYSEVSPARTARAKAASSEPAAHPTTSTSPWERRGAPALSEMRTARKKKQGERGLQGRTKSLLHQNKPRSRDNQGRESSSFSSQSFLPTPVLCTELPPAATQTSGSHSMLRV